MKKEKEVDDKITIRQFKDGSSSWWVGYKHYCLDENNILQFVCGGMEDLEETEAIKDYIKRNKKTYIPKKQTVFEAEEKEYTTINFGKHAGKTTITILAEDKKWLSWMYKNYTFKVGEEKLKQEIKELLKIK